MENKMTVNPENLVDDMKQSEEELEKSLSVLSLSKLKKKAKDLNESLELKTSASGYIPTSYTKDELVDALIAAEIHNSVHDQPMAEVEGRMVEVSLAQIETSPLNFRNPIDYEDAQLLQSVKASGGLLKSPIVHATDRKDSEGRTIYEIVGGNRSTEALKRYVLESGGKLEDQTVTVIVREYSGTELQKQLQESLEMVMDNESQRPASPQDRLKAYSHLVELGLTQTAIAAKLGVSGAYVSQTLRLGVLPERIMDLVHFEFNKEFISREDVETLEKFDVPFKQDGEGNITVTGISLENAKVMAGLFPKPPPAGMANVKSKAKEYTSLKTMYDIEAVAMLKFLSSDKVIEAAMSKSEPDFKVFVRQAAIEEGLIEQDVKPKETKAKEVLTSSSESETIVEQSEAIQPGSVEQAVEVVTHEDGQTSLSLPKAKAVSAPEADVVLTGADDVGFFTYEDKREEPAEDEVTTRSAYEAGQDLFTGELILAEDWAMSFSDSLKIGDPKAFAAFKYLFNSGVIIENLRKK